MTSWIFFLCWTPVILLGVLAVGFKRPALELSIWGSLYSLGLVTVIFRTPVNVALLAGLDGVLTTLPLLLVILSGILLSVLLTTTGSLARIVDWFKAAAGDAFGGNVLITLGVGNFMEGAGVIAEPVVAPMLYAAGVSPMGSAALSIIGYAGLMTLEMAGIIVTVLSLVTGLPVYDLGVASAWLSVPATLLMAACIPMFLPRPSGGVRRMVYVLLCGLLVGMTALGAAAYLGISISGIVGGMALILVFMCFGSGSVTYNRTVLLDLVPFMFLLGVLLMVNMVPWIRTLTFERLVVTIQLIPIHTITFRPLFSAYGYLFLAFFLSARVLRVSSPQLKTVLRTGFSRGWRAFIAMGLFGAMGQILAYSGYGEDFAMFNEGQHIPWILSRGLEAYTGTFYPVFVPFLGWVGTFLTGYGVASLMLFGKLQVQAAGILGVSSIWLAAGLAVGASLGSISSPFKIALATPMCNAVGMEGSILRVTIPLGIASSLVIGILLWSFL
jgi:lactate permease